MRDSCTGGDFLLNPWAYPGVVGAGPIGTWRGRLVIPSTGAVDVLYRLRHEIYREDGPALEGDSENCASDRAVRKSGVTGRVSWLGREVGLSDANSYGLWGSPQSFACRVAGDRMECVIDFSRPMAAGVSQAAKKAGLPLARAPIRFTLERVESGRVLSCPAE